MGSGERQACHLDSDEKPALGEPGPGRGVDHVDRREAPRVAVGEAQPEALRVERAEDQADVGEVEPAAGTG